MKLKIVFCFSLLFSACFAEDDEVSVASEESTEPQTTEVSSTTSKGGKKSKGGKDTLSTQKPPEKQTTPDPRSAQAAAELDKGLEYFSKNFKANKNDQANNGGKAPKGFIDKTNDKFQKECLKATNIYRKKHHANPLKNEPQVIEYSKSRCKLAVETPNFQNGQNGPEEYGENIFLSSQKDFSNCTMAIERWYNVVKKYDYKKPGNVQGTGQFTQLVWLQTTDVGCALCSAPSSKGFASYVVCNYNPSGNYQGEYEENVLKP